MSLLELAGIFLAFRRSKCSSCQRAPASRFVLVQVQNLLDSASAGM